MYESKVLGSCAMPKGGGYVLSVGVVTIRTAENLRQTLVVCHFVKFSVFYSRSANLDSCRTRFLKRNASRDLRSAPANLRSRELLKRTSLIKEENCIEENGIVSKRMVRYTDLKVGRILR